MKMFPVIMLGVALTACADIDPDRREGMWQPNGSNTGNLASMVVDPMDLVRGKSADVSDGGYAAAAVAKMNRAGPGGGAALPSSQSGGATGGSGGGSGSASGGGT